MAYIKSTNINVFPVTNRDQYDPAGKFTTEYNLTSLINKLVDRKAFVVSADITNTNTDKKIAVIDFNIYGYWVQIRDFNLTTTANTPYLNATIKFSRAEYKIGSSFYNHIKLVGEDSLDLTNSEYEGLTLDYASAPSYNLESSNQYSDGIASQINPDNSFQVTFTILKYDGSSWKVPDESKIKFVTSQDGYQHSVCIDDGVLG